jgi:hypothetical protein
MERRDAGSAAGARASCAIAVRTQIPAFHLTRLSDGREGCRPFHYKLFPKDELQ